MSDWESSLAAVRLMDTGLWQEALQTVSEHTLREVIEHRCGKLVEPSLPVVSGWQNYFRANYSAAVLHFVRQPGDGWLRAWADLGIAKVASDCGLWRSALEWCAKAWQQAAVGEHRDLMAEICGARGEVLLRAGCPTAAASSFVEDLALLGAGNRFSGRVRCYLAHAWSRMGENAAKAAKLYYQLAAHTASEQGTRAFSAAGLAIHGIRNHEPALVNEAAKVKLFGLPGFWVRVSEAKRETSASIREKFIQEALTILPPEYHAEHWWARGWLRGTVPDTNFLAPLNIHPFPVAKLDTVTRVEMPVGPDDISDAPWWDDACQPENPDEWWELRDHFMP